MYRICKKVDAYVHVDVSRNREAERERGKDLHSAFERIVIRIFVLS